MISRGVLRAGMSTKKPRKHERERDGKLVQAWVRQEMKVTLATRARSERRTLANFAHHELGKLVGIAA